MKLELRNMRIRCEKAEKERNDMLMRRVASLDSSASTKTTTSEVCGTQFKVIRENPAVFRHSLCVILLNSYRNYKRK